MLNWQPNDPKPDIHVQIEALSRFLARMPDHAEIRLKLARLHILLGTYDEAEKLLDERANYPDMEGIVCKAMIAQHRGQDLSAEELWRSAAQQGSTEARAQLSKLLTKMQRYEEAIPLCVEILEQNPSDFDAGFIFCKCLVALQRFEELEGWGSGFLDNENWHPAAPSALAYSGARSLPKMLGENPENGPTCYTDLWGSESASQLRERLMSHPSQSNFPTSNAGRGEGWRISHLLEQGIPGVESLFARVRKAVHEFANHASGVTDRPYLTAAPACARIESWANMFVEEGHEDWHCHPAGWISGVYYLDLPDAREMEGLEGQIEFGPLMLGVRNDLTSWPVTRIQPREDMLLLFPSYYGHRTYPTGSKAPRLSIAFDVVPVQ